MRIAQKAFFAKIRKQFSLFPVGVPLYNARNPQYTAPATGAETPATPVETKGEKGGSPSAKESRVSELLAELDGKSETTQRPVIDEIVGMGPVAIRPLAKALGSGASFQVRMASATALGELGDEKCVAPLVLALADSSLNVQRGRSSRAFAARANPLWRRFWSRSIRPEESVRRWSAEVLGKLGRQEVAPVLIEQLPRETADVQKSIVIRAR
jgi:HEAT repeat protein